MVKQAKPAAQLDEAADPLEEEYAELVGDLDTWKIDDDLSFPGRSGTHAAAGVQIVVDLDAGQTAAVLSAAEASGTDLVRFAKQAVLDAARAAPAARDERAPRRSVTVTEDELDALLREAKDLVAQGKTGLTPTMIRLIERSA